MTAKSLVIAAFILWSLISSRWYVCGIKEACGTRQQMAAVQDPIRTPAIEPDTVATIDLSGGDTDTGTAGRSDLNTAPPVGSAQTSSGKATDKTSVPGASRPMTSSIDEVQMETVADRMVIYFPYRSVRREDNSSIDDYLSRLADYLNSTHQKVSITGHTDFVGETADNQRVGLLRAASIRDVLVRKGVSKGQISIRSYGESKAIATNDTPQGRYRNRRVEIRVK